MNRLVVTVLGIVAAVGGSALVFIGINKLFDLTEDRYPLFSAIRGGLLSGGLFGLLWTNRMIESPVIVTLVAIVIGTGAGYALGVLEDRNQRLAASVGGGVALGPWSACRQSRWKRSRTANHNLRDLAVH